MTSVRTDADRLVLLGANGRHRQWSIDEIDWRVPVVVPAWFPRQTYIAAISQLYHGELATAKACGRLVDSWVDIDPDRRACLEIQIRDEIRHAEVYRTYLARLGDIASPDAAVAALLEGGGGWRDPDLGIMLAYHVLLEGEALHIQHGFATWLPCPLFRELNARIVVDEARHVGFGMIALPARLAGLSAEERHALLSWFKNLWLDCAVPIMERFRVPTIMTRRICRKWLESRWRRQVLSLSAVGLIDIKNADTAARL